jgi:hypothetical protein
VYCREKRVIHIRNGAGGKNAAIKRKPRSYL